MRLPEFVRRAAGRIASIGGNPGPQGILPGIFTSSWGTPPLMNTRALLEGYDTMPWLRATADKIGTALSVTDWRLYAIGKPSAPKSVAPLTLRDGRYVLDEFAFLLEHPEAGVAEMTAAALEAAGAEAARRVRESRGRLEPWARRDSRVQRVDSVSRWRRVDALKRGGELVEVDSHPFYELLENPNPFMGRAALIKVTSVAWDISGDAYWLLDRDAGGMPVGAWPIPAHWIVQTPTPQMPFYRVSWRGWQRAIPESEILWFHDPAPVHPYERGSGYGWAVGDELEIDEYLSKMTKMLFFNDADPKWIMHVAGQEAEAKRLERDIVQRNQGFWRKFKPYFLTGGDPMMDLNKKIHEFQRPTMEQLVYPGLRDKQRDVVLQVPGIPPELLGILENSNRATIEAAEYLFAKWVVLPRAERMRSVLQSKLLPQYDDRLVLDFPSPVAEDKEFELKVRQASAWAYNADEWRALGGAAPMDGDRGCAHLVPMNSYATTDPADPAQRPQKAAPTEPAGPKEL